jgi:FlaA1/EpsC-like NDP-sugar epimerase
VKKLLTKITNNLIFLPRYLKSLIIVMFDSIAIISSLLLSFSLRFGYLYFPDGLNSNGNINAIFLLILFAPFIAIPIFYSFGLYRSIIRYIGLKSLWVVGQAVSLYAVIWGLITYMLEITSIPRSAILINWMLALLMIGGGRIFARWLLVSDQDKAKRKKVVIYGAGSAGTVLSTALNSTSNYSLIAFVDDASTMQGSYINGIQVMPALNIKKLVKEKNIDEVLLAIPSLSRSRRTEIINNLSLIDTNVRIMPSMAGIADGYIKVEDLREIDISDLLGRNSIPPNKELMITKITKKVVMVTGAGGSIGSELCRQLLSLNPKLLILYEINEYALYQIHNELDGIKNSNIQIFPILGSISDSQRLTKICENFEVQTIYHSAAYKHVPLVEHNISEGVLNNIIGTKILAEVAMESNVETFVLISTDKAVRPTNTMGATKRVSEMILQGLASKKHKTCFTMVRFGNVLDSSGSVIPLFKKQIKNGGPVTVTDIDIVRYFMTIPEAIELVIQSGAMSKGGDVFVLDMGSPIKIYDLARRMIELSGLVVKDSKRPDGDIEIKLTGLRPGEKLFEELLVGHNSIKTENPLIMRANEEFLIWDELELILNKIEIAARNSNHQLIRELLMKIVPEFNPQCGIEDYLYNKNVI